MIAKILRSSLLPLAGLLILPTMLLAEPVPKTIFIEEFGYTR